MALVMIAFTVVNWIQTGVISETGSILAFVFGAGSKSLALAFAFGSLAFDDESENMGGFGSTVYFAIKRDIASWPTAATDPSTDDQAAVLSGNFTMESGKYFFEVYGTPDTVGVSAESQGERDAKSYKIKGELLYPSTRKAAQAFARKINNAHGVVIMVDPNTGQRHQFGSELLPCTFSASVDFGKAPADRRGTKIMFECDSFIPSWIYQGTIPLSGATLPGVS